MPDIKLTSKQKEVVAEFRSGKNIGVKESYTPGYWQEDCAGLWSEWESSLIDELCELGLMTKAAHPPIFKDAFTCALTTLGNTINID